MSHSLLIQRGRVIDPRNGIDGIYDLLLQAGHVAQLSKEPLPPGDAEVLDATGKWVTPGFIDLHVHLREPGEERKETILTGSRAAVAGGFTAVVAMPNTRPVNDSVLVTQLMLAKAREANLCRVYPAGSITKGLLGEELSEIATLVNAGCVCITDDGRPVMNAALMRRALQWSKPLGVPVMVHEEDLNLSGGGAMTEGPRATRLGLKAIPPSAEVAMVARDLVLVEETGCRLHIAHLSCEGSVRLVRDAKARGLPVTAEAAPHHFTLTDAAVEGYDTHAKMHPPLRLDSDVRAVCEGLADGTIDAIATDHAPHGVLDKQVEFEKAMNGIVGLETAFSLSYGLVKRGVIDERRLVELLAWGPARIFGLPGGHLAEGAPGDVTIVDPAAEWTVDADRFFSKSRNTPFQGMRLSGQVTHTVVGGRVVFAAGEVKEATL